MGSHTVAQASPSPPLQGPVVAFSPLPLIPPPPHAWHSSPTVFYVSRQGNVILYHMRLHAHRVARPRLETAEGRHRARPVL